MAVSVTALCCIELNQLQSYEANRENPERRAGAPGIKTSDPAVESHRIKVALETWHTTHRKFMAGEQSGPSTTTGPTMHGSNLQHPL